MSETADHPFESARLRFPDMDRNTCIRCKLPKGQHTSMAQLCRCEIVNFQMARFCPTAEDLLSAATAEVTEETWHDVISVARLKFANHIIDATLIYMGDRVRRGRQEGRLPDVR